MSTAPQRLPRPLHPGAWWLWAIGLATAASRTTNPILLALIIAVVAWVVVQRRSDDPWAGGLHVYLVMGLAVIAIRIVFRMLLDGQDGGHVLFTLPTIPLPQAAAGIRIGGAVTLEGVLAASYDGLRLATLLICLGAANLLANPKRLLKAVPSALAEVGTAITVSLSIAPQLIDSARRIGRARRLRGDDRHDRRGRTRRARHLLDRVAIPIMTDALDRSMMLAAAMDSRGYGRRQTVALRTRRVSGALVLLGLIGVCVGTYGLLDATTPAALGLPMLLLGAATAIAGFVIAGRRVARSRYRPDPWLAPEWLVAASGIAVATAMIVIGNVDPDSLNPSVSPLRWPTVALTPVLVLVVAAWPGRLAPPVERAAPVGAMS